MHIDENVETPVSIFKTFCNRILYDKKNTQKITFMYFLKLLFPIDKVNSDNLLIKLKECWSKFPNAFLYILISVKILSLKWQYFHNKMNSLKQESNIYFLEHFIHFDFPFSCDRTN